MKHSILKKLTLAFAGSIFGLAVSFSAMAAVPEGTLEGADASSVYGWVWDSDNYGHVIPVEISVYAKDSSQALKTSTVKADHYQENLQESIGDGYHGFTCPINWDEFEQDELRVAAYAATEEERVFLGELTFYKESGQFILGGSTAPSQAIDAPQSLEKDDSPAQGPGEVSVSRQAPEQASAAQASKQNSLSPEDASEQSLEQPLKDAPAAKPEDDSSDDSQASSGKRLLSWQKGPGFSPKKEEKPEAVPISLGMFTVTGYCGCDICCPSSVSKLTYSGTPPQADHTISADIDVFPIGTRLMIDGTVYTVEDIGSNVNENKIDIFYATHEEALSHGTTTEEVFLIPD